MGRVKYNIAGAAPEDLAQATPEGGARYAGKTPPKGVYRGKVRFLKLRGKVVKGKFQMQLNRSQDPMIAGAVVIDEPKNSPKAKYNGYLVNFNQNISKVGAPYVNTMLDAFSGGSEPYRRSFWKDFVSVDDTGLITFMGKARYTDNTVEVLIATKDGKNPTSGERTLEVASWMMKGADTGPDDDEDEDEDADEDVEFDSDSDEDEDSDDEASEFESDSDDEDEDADEDSSDEDADEDESDGDDEAAEDAEDEAEDEAEADGDDEPEKPEYDADAMRAKYVQMDRDTIKARAKEYGLKIMKNDTVETLADKVVEFEREQPPF
jgi:hypothetical protein